MKAYLALTFSVLAIACSRTQADVEHATPGKKNDIRLSGSECPKGRGTLQRVQLAQLLEHGEIRR